MLRRTSSTAARRRPSPASSDAETASRSSAPTVSATCASFGSVHAPVHLNGRDVVADEARQRHALHVIVARRRDGGIGAARQRRERANHGDAPLERRDALPQRHDVGRLHPIDGRPGEREPGDVDLFDRAPGVLQAIDRRFGDQLQPRRLQGLQQGPQRRGLPRGKPLEIRQRESRHGHARGGRADRAHARDGGREARRRADDPDLSGRDRPGQRRISVGRHVGHPHEGRAETVKAPPHVIGHHSERQDVVAGCEDRNLGVGNGHADSDCTKRGVSPPSVRR